MLLKKPRTKSYRSTKVKLPGGRVTIHYKKKSPSSPKDPYTHERLHGVPRLTSNELKKLPKSKRRPNRPYGGVLSSASLKNLIFEKYITKSFPLEVGRLIVKTAGRDSGRIGVIIDILDNKTVLIDGQVRRRKCNISHIETLDNKIEIKPKVTTDSIIKELKSLNIDVKKTKPKSKRERLKSIKKQKKEEQPKTKKPNKKGNIKKSARQ